MKHKEEHRHGQPRKRMDQGRQSRFCWNQALRKVEHIGDEAYDK
jgi:hypothetical protein